MRPPAPSSCQDVTMLRDVLASLFERNRISASLEILPAADLRPAAERARQQVLDRKLDAIVVGGGDGSIRIVASVLSGSDVPLGIIPAPEQAVAVIGAGEARSVDVGEVNGEFFVNNSSVGIYPYLILERERRRRRQGLSKWTAMILAAGPSPACAPARDSYRGLDRALPQPVRIRREQRGSPHNARLQPCPQAGDDGHGRSRG